MIDIDPSCAAVLSALNIAPGFFAGIDYWGWASYSDATESRVTAAFSRAYMNADLLIGCQHGEPTVLTTVQRPGYADPNHPKEWTQTLVAFTDHEAADAYLADRGRDGSALQFNTLHALTSDRPSPQTWYQFMRSIKANMLAINPSGPLSAFGTIPEPRMNNPMTILSHLLKPEPLWTDADERRQIRATIDGDLTKITTATDAGDVAGAKQILDKMASTAPFVSARAGNLVCMQEGRWFAQERDVHHLWGHLDAAGGNGIMFGLPEDAANAFLLLGDFLINALEQGTDEPDWVKARLNETQMKLKIVKPRDYQWRPDVVADFFSRCEKALQANA